jgi:hypothetical protein
MRILVSSAIIFALVTTALPAEAQSSVCPCIPLTHVWIVKTCTDWTCASTELAVANGDPQVIAIPAGMNDTRWLVVRRFAAGAAIDVSTDPFHLEQFDHMDDAVQRFSGIETDHRPMLMTAPDGQVLVIALRQSEPRRRAAGH